MKSYAIFFLPVLLFGCGGKNSNSDVTKPAIILLGASSVSLESGATYTDAGATATDDIDGTITTQIVTINPVDTSTVGTYTITYNVSDAAGNTATAVTRAVEIVEPVLTGVFTDSAVEGLTYTTTTQSGVTDASGTFQYQAGESVVFSIGTFQLGESATAAAEMTPLDLISGAALPTTVNEVSRLAFAGRQSEPDAVAFRKLSNLLVLLQALDSDKDASNGITIADGVGGIIGDVTIDITMDSDEFKSSTALIELMNAAVTAEVVSSGFIKSAGVALIHFYEAQSTASLFKAPGTLSIDLTNDGTVDLIDTFTYDADGNQLTKSTDSNADGTANYIDTFTYDADGNQLTKSTDSNADGTANEIKTNTWDANGYLLTASRDRNGDGAANEITTYTYDAKGNQLTKSTDSNADGAVNRISTNTYFYANSNLLTRNVDFDADGIDDSFDSFTYDANGDTLTQSRDYNADSITDYLFTFTHDANGNKLTQSVDSSGDGASNDTQTWTYDDNGNQLTYSEDYGADGVDQVITYAYDANGNLLTQSVDSNADGTANEILTNTYDTTGNRTTQSLDQNGDGTANFMVVYTLVDSTIGYAYKSIDLEEG